MVPPRTFGFELITPYLILCSFITQLNGILTNIPVTLLNGKIQITGSNLVAIVRIQLGLIVTYDYNWHVLVRLVSSYYGLTRGLCGNFNKNTHDELITSDERSATSVLTWAQSWKVNDWNPFCFDVCPGHNCPICTDANKILYRGDKQCGLINKEDGPFRECHSLNISESFFEGCLYDVCINGGAKRLLCQALNAYAVTCQNQGVKIFDWRTPSGCSEY